MTKEYDTIASLWHSFYQLMSTSGQEPDTSEEQPGLPGTGSHVVTMKQGQQQKWYWIDSSFVGKSPSSETKYSNLYELLRQQIKYYRNRKSYSSNQISAQFAICKWKWALTRNDKTHVNLTQEKPLNSAWSREDSCPWTGVNVGCSLVNSSSKLLVSALPFYENVMRSHGSIRNENVQWLGNMEEVCACSTHHRNSHPWRTAVVWALRHPPSQSQGVGWGLV